MVSEAFSRAVRAVMAYTDGAVGAGLALVVLPCIALYFGIPKMFDMPTVGLPILAVFGIMILFGALALISTLFARLGLSDRSQAFALPEGSIRAAIALSLIVLFSIISIMLYQTLNKPYVIPNLTEDEKAVVLKDASIRVIAVLPVRCAAPVGGAAPAADCPPGTLRYAVHVRQPAAQESTDLAKQLLILIGTLMTSVTSFYFASRATESQSQDDAATGDTGSPPDGPAPRGLMDGGPPAAAAATGAAATAADPTAMADADAHVDACDVEVTDVTHDEDLPPARGGVAS